MKRSIAGSMGIIAAIASYGAGLLFAQAVPTVLNVLDNGSFEKVGRHVNAKVLGDKGYDVDTALNAWCEGWTVSPGHGEPGKVHIMTGEYASDGKRYLKVESESSYVYTSGGDAGKTYHWQFWAKGETFDVDGKHINPIISVAIYEYGVKDKLSTRSIFLNTRMIKKISLTDQWQSFKGQLITKNNKATHFSLALGLAGNVSLDNVSLVPQLDTPLNRVFYLPFEDSLDAAESSGDSKASIFGNVIFAQGKKGNAAVFRSNAHLQFDALNNLNQNEGTITMWVKPLSDFDDDKAHCLFEVPETPNNSVDGGLVLTKGFSRNLGVNLFYFMNCSPWHSVISSEMKDVWKRDQWVHLIFTWSQNKGKMIIYADGIELLGSKTPFSLRPFVEGRRMMVGARGGGVTPASTGEDKSKGNKKRDFPKSGGNSANAMIDELQIFDRMVSPQEAWVLSGRKGDPLGQESKKVDAKELYVLNNDYVTPCVPFAKPMVSKPRVLFITPNSSARDVIELAQRMDLETDAFVGVQHMRQNRGAFDLQYKNNRIDRYFDVEDRLNEIYAKLDRNPEVIVLVNADLSQLPKIKSRIHQKVENGASLIMTSRAVYNGPWSKNRIKNGSKAIANGVSWSSLIDLFPNTPLKPNELSEKVIETFSYGKGRVVAIRFREAPVKIIGFLHPNAGLTPCLYNVAETRIPYTFIPYTREWDTRYGQYLSMIGRAVRWAVSGKSSYQIVFPEDGQCFKYSSLPLSNALKLQIQGAESASFILELSVKDSLGTVEYQRALEITGTDETLDVAFAVPVLSAGQYYADFQLKLEGQVADWGSIAFQIVDPEEIDTITLTTDSIEKCEFAEGKIALLDYAKSDLMLTIQAVDGHGRIYQRKFIPVERGQKVVPFKLKLDTPSTIANHIEAELVRQGKIISKASIVVFVPKRNLTALDSDEFPSIIWGSQDVCDASGMIFLRRVRELGFNTMLTWPINTTMRNIAMVDFTPAVYISKIDLKTKDGGVAVHRKVKHLTSDGSFNNPIIKGAFQEELQSLLKDVRKYGPLFYSLGDENKRYGEFGYSPFGIKAYTDHLMKKYGTIQDLNDTWGSSYSSFYDVPRLSAGKAKSSHNVPAMIDHRTVQESVWRGIYTHLQKVIKEYDPKASVGAEGTGTDDLEAMLEQMEVWAPYGHDQRVNKLMSNVARLDQITGHWTGAYEEYDIIPEKGLTGFWEQLLKKYGNTLFYFSSGFRTGGIFDPGAGLRPFFKEQLPDFKLIQNGVGQLIRQTTAKPSGVYMHWSQPSRWGAEADDALGTPAENDAVLLKVLDFLNVPNWGYITDRQLRSKPETINKARLLILPASQCVSAAEAKAFKDFVRDGGVILGIGPVGMRNEYGRELPSSQLDELFGVKMKSPALSHEISGLKRKVILFGRSLSLESRWCFIDGSLAAAECEVLAEADGIPLVVHHRYGKGDAVFLNLNAQSLDGDSLQEIIAAVLARADIYPFVTFSPDPGPVGRYGVLQNGDMTLVGVILDHRPGKWNDGKIHLKERMHVYDVKKGLYLGEMNEIAVKGRKDIQSVALFSLQKAKITGVSIDAPVQAERNKVITIGCSVQAPAIMSCAGRVVRIELQGPDGKARRYYQRMAYLNDAGTDTVSIEFAFNDPAGKWTIIATDVASGVKSVKAIMVK